MERPGAYVRVGNETPDVIDYTMHDRGRRWAEQPPEPSTVRENRYEQDRRTVTPNRRDVEETSSMEELRMEAREEEMREAARRRDQVRQNSTDAFNHRERSDSARREQHGSFTNPHGTHRRGQGRNRRGEKRVKRKDRSSQTGTETGISRQEKIYETRVTSSSCA